MKKQNLLKVLLVSGITLTIITGCTPPETMMPVFGPGSERIMMYILIVAVGYLLWDVYKNRTKTQEDHVGKHLKQIDSQLKTLEEDIQNIKAKLEGKDHDER